MDAFLLFFFENCNSVKSVYFLYAFFWTVIFMKRRKLTNLNVKFISLVRKPATGLGWLLKNENAAHAQELLHVQKNEELKRIYGIVYTPNVVDKQGDYTDEAEILKAQERFSREQMQGDVVDKEHNFMPIDASVVESWIVRKGDPLFSEYVGAWAVGVQVYKNELWESVKKGDLTGLSLAGEATVQPVKEHKENEINVVERLKSLFFEKDKTNGDQMDAELKTALEGISQRLGTLEKSAPKVETKEDKILKAVQELTGRIDKLEKGQKDVKGDIKKGVGDDAPDGGKVADDTISEDLQAEVLKTVQDALSAFLQKGVKESGQNKPDDNADFFL